MNATAFPTRYDGVFYRSRLEARWAAFFDLLGWPHVYEPFDLEGYIPDFVLLFHEPILVEVKPELYLKDLGQHGPKIEASGWDKEALIVGARLFEGDWTDSDSIGLLRIDQSADFLKATMARCGDCGRPSFVPAEAGWGCRVCGAYRGDKLMDHSYRARPLWNLAGEKTQWHRGGGTP